MLSLHKYSFSRRYFRKIRYTTILVLGCLIMGVQVGYAQLNRDKPDAVKNIGIKEKLGQHIPPDITLVNSQGDTVRMGELLGRGKPILLNPGYYQCPQLCSLIRTGVFQAVRKLSWDPGKDYNIVSFSFDSTETTRLADSVKKHYIKRFDRKGVADGWYFMTGSGEQVSRLTRSVGYGFKYIESKNQIAHQSAIVFVSPKGKITRYLYGIQYDNLDVKNALYEAADGKIGSTVERVILSCYQYNPKKGSYVPVAFRIMKLGGIATAVILGGVLAVLWYRERVKKKNKS